jgi:hypothetical protein
VESLRFNGLAHISAGDWCRMRESNPQLTITNGPLYHLTNPAGQAKAWQVLHFTIILSIILDKMSGWFSASGWFFGRLPDPLFRIRRCTLLPLVFFLACR